MISIINVNGTDEVTFLNRLSERIGSVNEEVTASVTQILRDVKARGDEAVAEYTKKFDGQLPPSFEVSRDEINDALTEADPAFVDAMLNAVANITEFHNRQKQQSFIDAKPNGVLMGQRIRGLKRVGLYVPNGRYPYPSTVLMTSIPAKVAGVGEIAMISPAGKDGKIANRTTVS